MASTLDTSDILRSCVVAAVSAFDTLIHNISRIGMVEVYTNSRTPTNAFKNFKVSIGCLPVSASEISNHIWFENEVRRQHSWQSFQQPEKVAEAIKMFCDQDLWKEMGLLLNKKPESIRKNLSLIVDRRNKIVHEADSDPTSPGARWPIDESLVQDAIDTLESIGTAIFQISKRR
jgi:RiboL-PSP-HEPN